MGRAEQVLLHFLSNQLAESLASSEPAQEARQRADAARSVAEYPEGCSCPVPGRVVALSCEAHGRPRPLSSGEPDA